MRLANIAGAKNDLSSVRKNGDAQLVRVVRGAAEQIGCSTHLRDRGNSFLESDEIHRMIRIDDLHGILATKLRGGGDTLEKIVLMLPAAWTRRVVRIGEI